MLIAVAILGMVIGLATFGYSLFARDWSGQLGRFDSAQAQYPRLGLVVAALEDTLPYVVRADDGTPGFYFLGRDEGLTLVTTSPVFTPGDLAVVRVFREAADAGRWNLVYEEAPLGTEQLRRANQTLPFAHRMIVLRDLPSAEFAYYGWASPQQRAEAADQPELGLAPTWSNEFDGLVRRQHPQRIALRLGGQEAVVFVPERAEVSFRRYSEQE
jgi:hypothetical protein